MSIVIAFVLGAVVFGLWLDEMAKKERAWRLIVETNSEENLEHLREYFGR